MENQVAVNVIPAFFERKKCIRNSSLKQKIADQNLSGAKEYILRSLKYDIPLHFNYEVNITISLNLKTLGVKVDYSKIRSATDRILIDLYLSKDIEGFYKKMKSVPG